MINRKKLTIVIGVGLGILLVLIVGVVFAVGIINKQRLSNEFPKKVAQSTMFKTSQSSKTNASTKSSESTSTSSRNTPNQNQVVETFLKTYLTWNLTPSSIDQRTQRLQSLMTTSCYQANNILQDATQLKALLTIYQKTKQIDTSNSTALVSRQYLNSNIYQNANSQNQYYVDVTYTETPVYQKTGYTMEAKYNLTIEEGQVLGLTLLSQQAVKGQQNGS